MRPLLLAALALAPAPAPPAPPRMTGTCATPACPAARTEPVSELLHGAAVKRGPLLFHARRCAQHEKAALLVRSAIALRPMGACDR